MDAAMDAAVFAASWARAWRGLSAHSDGVALRDTLLARYAEPHRHYHTTQHLAECLAHFETLRDAPDHAAAVEMALWFHDAVYDLGAADNESRSATWARVALGKAGVAAGAAARVEALVLATKHAAPPVTRDEQVLIDIDLAILGAEPARFAEYEGQVRAEYAHVPAVLYAPRRCALLQGFLDRDAIYHTPAMHRRLEARARENLARSVAALSAMPGGAG